MRPRFFDSENATEEQDTESSKASSPSKSSPSTASSEYTATEKFFLRCEGAVQGVCELHKASFSVIADSMILFQKLHCRKAAFGTCLIPCSKAPAGVRKLRRLQLSLANGRDMETAQTIPVFPQLVQQVVAWLLHALGF